MATSTIKPKLLDAPTSLSNIDLGSYTKASGNKYVFPIDGYVFATPIVNTTANTIATVEIYAPNMRDYTYISFRAPNTILVPIRKGMAVCGENFNVLRFVRFNY